ncbi:MAG: hypothetical protein LKI58_07330 [Actinomyces sp.]|jgi:hypothetical protein|nr:hypothetical protein [Actinomyces sp.]MCI1642668.1 hypothetical protein [Actinomyces sp.]MCI1787862.1 hypothetical protein [Actinomyces sp.]MCI1829802.1 hypothetical protein [Actinomyces sp.]MCI1867344.1 hypothetical protein [Actinomyces sp.]
MRGEDAGGPIGAQAGADSATGGEDRADPLAGPAGPAADGAAPSWWRANRWYLAALVPALALAVAANLFRLVGVALPWMAHDQVRGDRSVTIGTEDSVVVYPQGTGADYRATLTVDSVVPATAVPAASDLDLELYGQAVAMPGARLWKVTLEVSAPPEMVLDECSVELTGPDGTRYGSQGGKMRGGEPYIDYAAGTCVPLDAPGPTFDWQTFTWVAAEVERPDAYEVQTFVAVPSAVTPSDVRVDMGRLSGESGTAWVMPTGL